MTVMVLERVPSTLRGELTRWMVEPHCGIFVGNVSAMVRERLWEKAFASSRDGAGILIWSRPSEQGFEARSFGTPNRTLVDFEGLTLVEIPKAFTHENWSGGAGWTGSLFGDKIK